MLILSGWGSIAGLVITVAVGALLEAITGSRAISYFIGGLAMAAFGLWLNHIYEADEHGKGTRHSIFWVPIEYWGGLIAVGALLGA